MKNHENESRLPCERDHPIPEPDPNLTEEEKKQKIAEAEAKLEELYRNRNKYAFSKEKLIELEKKRHFNRTIGFLQQPSMLAQNRVSK